jgi:hypothetical protein
MADKYKGYTLEEKQAAIRDAIKRMEPVHVHWRMLESLYRTGAQRELTMIDLNRILPFPVPGSFLRTVNMLLPHLSMVINTVTARDPKMVVTPLGGDIDVIERNARLAQEVLGYFWRRTDATSVLRDMTQDCVLVGNGFAKVGWSYSETTKDRTADDVALEVNDLLEAARELALEMGQVLDDAAIAELVESVSLTNHLVEVDEPYVEYVSPYDVFLPANARRLGSARWVAQRLRLPLEDLKANELFDKKAREDLRTDTGYVDPTTLAKYEETEHALPAAFAHATVFEFYDMKNRTMCVFQLDAEKPLFEGPIPYEHRHGPFVHMRNFNDGGNSFWSFGDLENVAGLQLMINEIMVAELGDLKRVGNKYFINKKVLTPELTKALADNRPDQVIPVDLPANISMQEVMQPVTRLATPADNYAMEAKLQDYMQRIIGVTDFQAGQIASASRVSATAAAAVEGSSTTRAMDKMASVEKASREIGTRMLALCQQFLDNERAIRIAGPDAPEWLRVSQSDIEGEFSIETEGGSTQAINPATRARQGVEIMQQVVPALSSLGYDPTPALRTALTYMGLNPDHLLVKPEPAPMPEAPAMPVEPGMPEGMPPVPMDPSMMDQLMDMGAPPDPMQAQYGGGIAL